MTAVHDCEQRRETVASMAYVPIPDSERDPLPGAEVIGLADPDQRIQVTVSVRRRPGSGVEAFVDEQGARPVAARARLTREALAVEGGADEADLEQVEAFARANGLTPDRLPGRQVLLEGTVAAMEAAFQVELKLYRHEGG